jgi:hypothetical protein
MEWSGFRGKQRSEFNTQSAPSQLSSINIRFPLNPEDKIQPNNGLLYLGSRQATWLLQ